MAIDLSGKNALIKAGEVIVEIKENHPLIMLANSLPWDVLSDLVVSDLKATTSNGFWFTGRKIKIRIHLGAYLLQKIFNLTDRKTEYQIKDNAAFQLFCGINTVESWHAPDHTKIEKFRNRLSPETQRIIANSISKLAVNLGFGDPSEVDFDSTVQEANISYPADANIMSKLAMKGKVFFNYLKEKVFKSLPLNVGVDIKSIKNAARKYFFLAKNKSIEVKRKIFKELHCLVKQQLRPVVELCNDLSKRDIKKMPWNIRRIFYQLKEDSWRYLLDVGHFTRTHTLKAGKILSFHAKELACIKKGKIGKDYQFGRAFQLGRIKGNFLYVLQSTSIEMNDKVSFLPLLEEHSRLFGQSIIETVATDKGYWSQKNQQTLIKKGITSTGLQRPSTVKIRKEDMILQERLQNRRAGIEPLIGHVKHGGQLGKSRMKTDTATLAAGYGSVLAFNLRQMIRWQQGKMEKIKVAA